MFQFKGGEKAAGTITGRVMFFLMRMAFWLGVVCLLLPSSGSNSTSPDAQVKAAEAVTLASAAVSDARGFCDRQPTACKVGSKVAVALGHRAEAGARTLYEFVTGSLSGKSGAADSKLAKVVPVRPRRRHADGDRPAGAVARAGSAAAAAASAGAALGLIQAIFSPFR